MTNKEYKIVVFFSGGINSFYQIEQWQKPFEKLSEINKILYLITDKEVYKKYKRNKYHKNIKAKHIETFTNIIEFYQKNEIAVTLYINNSLRNFQALRYSRGYHVHLNHGESEKESMRSNQSQAYDYIFTVGQRAVNRYKEFLLNFDSKKYIQVGRPQLDFIEKLKINKNKEKVILYAPTWEATHSSMNYTSVHKYGVGLVNKILQNDKYILIYKPHSAIGTRDKKARKANKKIIKLIKNSRNAYYMKKENINDVFTLVDFSFFDNTSVMIDYLKCNKPAAYLEVIEDQSINLLTKVFSTINSSNYSKVEKILKDELVIDSKKSMRKEVKEFYLGKYKNSESTKLFISEISKLIKKRENKIDKIKKG